MQSKFILQHVNYLKYIYFSCSVEIYGWVQESLMLNICAHSFLKVRKLESYYFLQELLTASQKVISCARKLKRVDKSNCKEEKHGHWKKKKKGYLAL